MDKTDFVKQLATLESLTDWEDGDAFWRLWTPLAGRFTSSTVLER